MYTNEAMNLDRFPLVSNQISRPALQVVLRELERVLATATPGAVAEFGCYIGTTSLFIRRVLDAHDDPRAFHVYDSFEGLPPKTGPDASAAGVDFVSGVLAVSKKQFLEQFQRAHLKPPIIHKGWFNQLGDADVPSELAFAFLDGDFYESILASLRLCWPRLTHGGTLTIDDYKRETLPGVERAVADYFGGVPGQLRYEQNIAVLRKA